jgi:anhydro-N-acetylmuramic acid kinase
VICDFRVQDVQLGGQGHHWFIRSDIIPRLRQLHESERIFQNISFLENNERIAFDISYYSFKLYANQLGLDYDDKGALTRG